MRLVMPDPIDKLFENAIKLPEEPLPLHQAESLQPATVSGVGELKSGSGSPASQRLHDQEIALIITEDHLMGDDEHGDDDDRPRRAESHFIVRVEQSGGEAGDATTQCSFTYIVYDLQGGILDDTDNNPIEPERPRPEFGTIVAPTSDLGGGGNPYGIAFYDETDTFHLWDVGEVPAVEVCT